jgi:putative nucleotidyltransferase with HDIG domain
MAFCREYILHYAKSLACLPSLDAVTQKLSQVLAAKKISLSRLFDLVQYDPALSSKIIAVANSAWHNRGVPIVNLKRAMIALGLEEVKDVLICALFYDGVLKKCGLRREHVFLLWKHSLLAAFAARAIASQEQKDTEKAFTAGLLHDIGKVPLQLLFHYSGDGEKVTWDNVCAKERERFGTDHQEIGFYMATEWKLPEEYRHAMRLHHETSEGPPLAEVVKQANILMVAQTEDQGLLAIKGAALADADRAISLFGGNMD